MLEPATTKTVKKTNKQKNRKRERKKERDQFIQGGKNKKTKNRKEQNFAVQFTYIKGKFLPLLTAWAVSERHGTAINTSTRAISTRP